MAGEEGTPRGDKGDQPRDRRALTPEALRALAEAEERRRGKAEPTPSPEIGGRGGLDPARYGDWEKKGIASDF